MPPWLRNYFVVLQPGKRRQYAVICLVAMVDGADLAIMGACFRAFEEELHLGPFALGLMSLAQSLTTALAAPVWGWMSDNRIVSRRSLWAGAALGWGVVMACLAVCSNFALIILLRLANGCFLSCMAPLIQTWVAESVPPERSGLVFGVIFSSTNAGRMLSTNAAIALQGHHVQVGSFGIVSGWRLLCASISLIALGLSGIVFLCFDAQHDLPAKAPQSILGGLASAFGEMFENVRLHWRSHTFRVIVIQGTLGGTACNAFTFDTMFLQYLGMTSAQLAMLVSVAVIPELIGNITGGLFGDCMERRYPMSGRAFTAQICIFGLLSFAFSNYVACPYLFGPVVFPFAVAKCLLPMIGGIYHPGVMRPLLIRVADPKRRSSIIAWQHALEGFAAALFGAPLVGFLSEKVFDYKPSSDEISSMDSATREHNLLALQRAISLMTCVPLIISFVVNSYLHIAYPRDKRMWAEEERARMEDGQHIELDRITGHVEELTTLIGTEHEQRSVSMDHRHAAS